jgi:hypothetical protein
MLRIEIEEEEAAVLREALENYISDLGMEVSSTDSLDYREKLKHKRTLLQGIIERLNGGSGPG